jgi:outer membrane protein OmpA-like peptidoglycan-associated protein
MLRWRFAVALLAGTALGFGLTAAASSAEDVQVNMDALGPAPAAKQPAKPAGAPVMSEIVPDPAPDAAPTPKPAQPKLSPKPSAVPVAVKPQDASTGEIDFIGRTKRTQGEPADGPPAAVKPVVPPVVAAPVREEPPPPAAAPVTTAAPAIPAPPKPAPPKKKPQHANVVVNSGSLDGAGAPGAKLQGTPLTSVRPDGVLYVPQDTGSLPQPVAGPSAAPVEEIENKPLTLPPSLPDAPAPMTQPAAEPQAALPAPTANPPANMVLRPTAPKPAADAPPAAAVKPASPPSTQAVAAVTPPQIKPTAPLQRASVLAGQATAIELMFEQGQETLTEEAKSALDRIAGPLKSAGYRVQLAAYSGDPGNNSSDARRLSLKRALAVREYLGAQGIAAMTVNIAAFGGAVQGQTDRVDLMLREDQLSKLYGGP